MAEGLHGLAQEAKGNKLSAIASKVSEDDVVAVWDCVAAFIDKHLSQQKGVSIPGLGVFTFSQRKIDVGNSKYLLVQRPVFSISEKFAQTHQLNQNKVYLTGQVSVVPLNYSALSFESGKYDRDTMEQCVREVLNALSRSLAQKRNIEFSFTGIGRLTIRDSRVKMKFYKDFVNGMDGSGTLVKAMSNRPGTSDSVMSDRPPTRPHTSNTLVLPRIANGSPLKAPMPSIPEDGVVDETESQVLDVAAEKEACEKEEAEEDGTKSAEAEVVPQPVRAGSRQAMSIARASALSFHDDLLIPPTPKGVMDLRKSSPGALAESARQTPRQLDPIPGRLSAPRSADAALHQLHKPHPPVLQRSTTDAAASPASPGAGLIAPAPPSTSGSACGHPNAGQELCYLCHQREQRNVPVSFEEERRHRELEEDRLLQQYNTLKDTEAVLKETSEKIARRHDLQKNAAFNLGAAEAIKLQKKARDPTFQKSYIFQKRPLTPPKFRQQRIYFKDLNSQVQVKNDNKKKQKEDELFLERLEQVQLAEDLAAQREQLMRDKYDQRDQLKRALSAQVRFKPAQLPEREPDSKEPIFGKDDMTNEKLLMRRMRAQEVMQDQVDTVAQQKREAILRKVQEQQEDELVIEKARSNLLDERAARFQKLVQNRRRLEQDWQSAAEEKRKRELEEKLRSVSPGSLMHEQCDKYKRCGQCQRRMHNCGETNIWSDSRYIPGTRLMV